MPKGGQTEWTYETAPDLEESPVKRLERFPREPDLLVYTLRSIANVLIRFWLRVYHRFGIAGRENIPKGSCIIVANHQSHLDSVAILSALPLRRLHRAFPAAAKDYFFESVPRLALAAVVVNALPFARKAKGSDTLRMCRALLKNPGNILIIFPEGTRAEGPEMGEFLPGIGHIVSGAEVPVIPCRLRGAREAWPKHTRVPRPRKVTLTFGPPVEFEQRKGGRDRARGVAAQLRDAVGEL